jgi:acyl-CoA dehydrogenase
MNGQASRPLGSDAVAPDTRGWNFYTADRSLDDLLSIHLPGALYEHLKPHLEKLGWLAANELDEWARLADRHPPVLHHRDKFGRDVQYIEYHPAYREMERVAYGQFGMHAMSHRGGVLGWPDPYPAVAKHAFTYLFNQAEFGLGCPINVTDSSILLLRRYGSEELRARYLPRMLTTDVDKLWQGAQFMTEKEGGSDVGSAVTRAVQENGEWRIWGEKWFCSNADAESAMMLARPEGAGAGTRGLGLFYLPRTLEDGSPNRYRIVRLKDKLGTRSMASGEIKFEGAIAYPVGKLDRGFVQMADMVNWSRLSNGVKSTALMRRAAHDAFCVATGRIAFGRRIIDFPLARRQMLKILLPAEQALSVCMLTARTLDEADDASADRHAGSQSAQALLRLLTPVLKFRATRDARKVAGDAMEMRGGTGYVEEFASARVLRDAHLGSIWEGAGNIVAIDAIGRAVGRHGAIEVWQAAMAERIAEADAATPAFRDRLSGAVARAAALAERVAKSGEGEEALSRQATSALYHVTSAVIMAWEASRLAASRGDARRLLWARLVLDHRLTARDPLGPEGPAFEDAVAPHLLLGEPASLERVRQLIDG